MPINEPYTGSQAYGFFQMMPTRLEFVEPREQVAIFDWDQPKTRENEDPFGDMNQLNVDWGRFVDDTANAYERIWSDKTYTDTNINISYPRVTTVTYLPEIS